MIQLKNEILNDTTNTKNNLAILGLDLQSAFNKVRHCDPSPGVAAKPGQENISVHQEFFDKRNAQINAGDLRIKEKNLRSVGTLRSRSSCHDF